MHSSPTVQHRFMRVLISRDSSSRQDTVGDTTIAEDTGAEEVAMVVEVTVVAVAVDMMIEVDTVVVVAEVVTVEEVVEEVSYLLLLCQAILIIRYSLIFFTILFK